MILGVVGLHGAGKEEVAKILKRKGFTVLDMGDIIREEMKKAGIDVTHATDQKFPVELRKVKGNDIVARLSMAKITAAGANDVAIIGLRSTYELDYFKSKIPDMLVVAVDAPEEMRFERLKRRGRPGDPKTFEEFHARGEREAKANADSEEQRKAGLYTLIGNADYKIVNVSTRKALEKEVQRVLDSIKKSMN